MPSPKSGSAGKPTAPIKPGAAKEADKAKSGKAEAPREGGKPEKIKASQTKTPAAKFGKPAVHSANTAKTPHKAASKKPKKEVAKPCSAADLVVEDLDEGGGGSRVVNAGGVLQIVPPVWNEETESHSFLGVISVSVQRGDKDVVKATVVPKDPKSGGELKTALCTSAATPRESHYKAGASASYNIPALSGSHLWCPDATPVKKYLYGRGCDKSSCKVTLEVFPSDQYSAEISFEEAKTWYEDFKKGVIEFLLNVFGEEKEESNWKFWEGTVSLEWGWQEETDGDKAWQAYYLTTVSGGLDPLVGWAPDAFEFSLAKVALAAGGVPPPLADVFTKWLADIFVGLEIELSSSLTGSMTRKKYYNDNTDISGSIDAGGKGTINLYLAASLGSEIFVAVIVTGGGTSGLELAASIEIDSDGTFFVPELKTLPLRLYLKIEFKAFKKTVKDQEKSWEPIGEQVLLPRPGGKEKWKLVGKKDA